MVIDNSSVPPTAGGEMARAGEVREEVPAEAPTIIIVVQDNGRVGKQGSGKLNPNQL